MPETDGYRVPQVCKLVGITYRQLDYWARTGLVTPSIREAGGSGTQRLYSFRDLVQLKVVKNLLDAGLSLQKIRRAVEFLSEQLEDGPSSVTLMSDGSTVYAVQSADEIIDLVKGGQGVFAIAIDKVWNDLEGSVGPRKEGRIRTTQQPAGARGDGSQRRHPARARAGGA